MSHLKVFDKRETIWHPNILSGNMTSVVKILKLKYRRLIFSNQNIKESFYLQII